jgi:glucose/arabinose dehydrogenase
VSNGDGSCHHYFCSYRLRAQDLNSLAGKILRINPLTGNAYADNPFFDGNFKSNRSRVYSYGLRNPFRFAINPSNNEPYIGDVGWQTWEEINTGRRANFGWPCYEGGSGSNVAQESSADYRICKDLYGSNKAIPAIYAWYRAGTAAAAIGGDFYEGQLYPAEYQGAFFFGDFIQGWVRYITPDGQVRDFASGITGLVQMKVGPDTNLYYVNLISGKIVRLRYAGEGIARHVRLMFLKLRELAYLYPWR